MIVIGIDNGLKGAIAVIEPDDTYIVPIPVIMPAKGKNVYDEQGIYKVLEPFTSFDGVVCTRAFIEKAQAFPKNSAAAIHTSGTQYGMIRMACVVLGIPYTIISPRIWQKELFVGVNSKDTKFASKVIAKRLFPSVSLRRSENCKKDCDGMSDALLIAEYGRRTLTGK